MSVMAFDYVIDEETGIKLYELPNGVKDEIIDGKLIKRVSDEVNTWELTWSRLAHADNENYYSIRTVDLNLMPSYIRFSVYLSKGEHTKYYSQVYLEDDLVYYDLGHGNDFRFKVPKSVFANNWTLQETLDWLEENQVTLVYQLETQEVYNIEPVNGHHKVKLLINEFSTHIKNIALAISRTITEFFYDGEAITARGILFFAYVATVFCLSLLAFIFKRR
jgi:hypothetical protein